MDTAMDHRHVYAAWTRICGMDMGMQHGQGHGHASWTWTYIMDKDMQHGHLHRHAAWTLTWTCSIDMDMQHGHAVWTWTRDTDTDLVMQKWIWTLGMHGCRNADKKLSPASLVFC